MSLRKRFLALVGAGAAALLLGGGLGALHTTQPAFAGQPIVGAVGCITGDNNAQDITWPTFTGGGNISSTTPIPVPPAVTGALSLGVPGGVVLCAAVMQDADAPPANDRIDGGSMRATILSGGNAQILESQTSSYAWNCGSSSPVAFIDSCAGVTRLVVGAGGAPGLVGGVQGNSFHVGLLVGSTFGIVGTATPSITVSVTWTPFSVATPPDVPFTVGTAAIAIVAPVYAISLVANPATIPANLPTSTNVQGSVITAYMFHVGTGASCVVIVPGTATSLPTYSCNTSPTALAAVSAGAGGFPFLLVPGAEQGIVTFTTNLGVFSSAGPAPAGPVLTAVTGAAQTVAVACGTIPNTFPTTLVPTPGLFSTLNLNSCVQVSATLVGGGEAGTATVVGNFIGTFTGAQALPPGEVTVNMTPGPITVPLTTGCNEVLTPVSLAGGSTGQQVAALATGFNVTSIWVFNNATHTFQALYFPGNAPTDISSVGPNQSVFVCGTGAGTFRVA